jgi:hypothetical protein
MCSFYRNAALHAISQSVYWIVSMCLAGAAFVVSAISLVLGWKNRVDQRAVALLSKKTELLTKLVEAEAIFRHLAMIYAQKLLLIRGRGGIEDVHEAARIKANLNLVWEQSANFEAQYAALAIQSQAT